ncbi:MAG: alanine racemase [Syntrophus sp. (in: bacteria)]|nr:alanine racemase [Syntrophus sp. (in: bacteria)]
MIQTPRAVVYVNLNALVKNYHTIKALLPTEVKVLCVVKADAYGHGAKEVARRLESCKVDYLGVASVDEGMELRESGITAPILVMSGIFSWDEIEPVFKNRLTPVVYDFGTLDRIEAAGERYDDSLKVHMKVDTGMGRLGFTVDEFPRVIERIKEMRHVDLEGIMSHFSSSEMRDDYGIEQIRLFNRAVQVSRDLGIEPEIVHMANSGALTTYPDACFNMVRVGINLYGSHTAKGLREKMALKQVMKLVSRIAVLREFDEGSALSYGGTYMTEAHTKVAYIPLGYADGYPRSLSNRGSVLIKEKRCSIIGRICMDWLLVDVTGLGDIDVGEEVILLGRSGTQAITADEIAEHEGTIPYEVLCRISKRIMRVYV